MLYPQVERSIHQVLNTEPSDTKKVILQPMVDFINSKIVDNQGVILNFICTHNSRRSQFAQIWAQTAADYFGVQATCYSGGVEVTACNPRVISQLEKAGFVIDKGEGENPVYELRHSESSAPIVAFSKVFDDEHNSSDHFAAIMTCSDADENCPFIPGADARIAVRYNDPKVYDNTEKEAAKYEERSNEIASDMFYVFSQIK
ncbi:MAG: protein-tyrosine-phosphatase [Bacteroidia bacterium]|nr:protein-tyrosine-phosphatase [Bacteroidia bacterium]